MKFILSFLAILIITNQALAGGAFVPTDTSRSDNRAYAGLKWTLNEGVKPEAVIGVRHARVESSGDTDGGDLSISAKFIDGFQIGEIKGQIL